MKLLSYLAVSAISVFLTIAIHDQNDRVNQLQVIDCENENRALSQFLEEEELNNCMSIDLLRGCYTRLDRFRMGDYEPHN